MDQNAPSPDASTAKPRICGIIMPISAMPPHYSERHWQEVMDVVREAVEGTGFIPNLVSDSATSTVIHGNIINNLDANEMVVCDVSGKNPNVMFELGLRLCFDKPTIVIKDNITDYNFDTSPIKHLGYDHGLRHQSTIAFIKTLREAIIATDKEAKADPSYSPFLGFFHKKPKGLPVGEQSALDFISSSIASLSNQIASLAQRGAVSDTLLTKKLVEEIVRRTKTRDLLAKYSSDNPTSLTEEWNELTKGFETLLGSPNVNALYDPNVGKFKKKDPAD